MVKQLSVFVENKFGRLSAITDVLAKNGVDIRALSLADTSEFGVLRLIVDDPETAAERLRETGVMVKVTPVIAAYMDNRPGGLNRLMTLLTENGLSIEYMYAFMGTDHGRAKTVLRVSDPVLAAQVFEAAGVEME